MLEYIKKNKGRSASQFAICIAFGGSGLLNFISGEILLGVIFTLLSVSAIVALCDMKVEEETRIIEKRIERRRMRLEVMARFSGISKEFENEGDTRSAQVILESMVKVWKDGTLTEYVENGEDER